MRPNHHALLSALWLATGVGIATSSPSKASAADAYGVFNVKDFGAVPNDSVDDYRAIQDAIDAAGEAGGEVVFPPGTYRCVNGLALRNGVRLRGLGPAPRINQSHGAVRLKFVSAGNFLVIRSPWATSDVVVSNLDLDGTEAPEPSSGVYIDARTNGGAIAGLVFERVTVHDFKTYQVLQDGTVFDVIWRDSTFHHYGNNTAGDVYHVGPNGVPGQITFDHCFFIGNSAGRWSFLNEAPADVRFLGGTVGPNAAGAHGLSVFGGLSLYGTHLEGRCGTETRDASLRLVECKEGKASIGIRYIGATGAMISPSQCSTFGTNVQIGGTSGPDVQSNDPKEPVYQSKHSDARGWNLFGAVGGFNPGGAGDVVITAGGVDEAGRPTGRRNGIIGEIGYINDTRRIVDQKKSGQVVQLGAP